jgi:F0F1-type ATP synthase membrane subunit b/b'
MTPDMTQSTTGPTTGQSTTQKAADAGRTARDEAGAVGRTAADAGREVAGTAQDQAKQVTQEARRQAADLLQEARQQANNQVRDGQRRAGEGIRALAGELHGMAGGATQGPVSDLAAQAASRVEAVADWLDRREPGELVDELRQYARRSPGMFLLGAALTGALVGRLTRGAVEAQRPDVAAYLPGSGPAPSGPSYATTPGYAANGPVPHVTGPRPGYPASPPVPPAPRPQAAPYPGPPPVPPGGALPPQPHAPQHAPRPGATSVGDYVEELAREPRTGTDRPGGLR